MPGYLDDPQRTATVMTHAHYHTGDVATRDADGYYTYVGRNDDVFKCSDYRISPFELESLLIEHECVDGSGRRAEPGSAAPVGAEGVRRAARRASSRRARRRCRSCVSYACADSPFKRMRRIEFADLPKTVSGKIRRVELRGVELQRSLETRRPQEFWEDDFGELKRE